MNTEIRLHAHSSSRRKASVSRLRFLEAFVEAFQEQRRGGHRLLGGQPILRAQLEPSLEPSGSLAESVVGRSRDQPAVRLPGGRDDHPRLAGHLRQVVLDAGPAVDGDGGVLREPPAPAVVALHNERTA